MSEDRRDTLFNLISVFDLYGETHTRLQATRKAADLTQA